MLMLTLASKLHRLDGEHKHGRSFKHNQKHNPECDLEINNNSFLNGRQLSVFLRFLLPAAL